MTNVQVVQVRYITLTTICVLYSPILELFEAYFHLLQNLSISSFSKMGTSLSKCRYNQDMLSRQRHINIKVCLLEPHIHYNDKPTYSFVLAV